VKGGNLLGATVLGRYRVVRLLARGGMGEIYLARSEGAAGFAIPVVIKSVLGQYATDASVLEMFKREARIMSNLRHPGIVSVLDFGVEGGEYLMVLEYVHGFHVGRWARWLASRRQPFPVERAIHIALTVLDALAYAHSRKDERGEPLGIVHRDVSPSNVLVDVEGHVKVADFGVARMQGDNTEVNAGEGAARTVKGKFPYLPADLLLGTGTLDAGVDVYATAVVLDELLRGTNPFRAADLQLTVGRVVHLVPDRLDTVRTDVSPELADVVARALAKRASERFSSAEEFARALRAVRRVGPDEAAAELAAAARRDFSDPQMSRDLGVDGLSVLSRAWKEPRVGQEHDVPVADRDDSPARPRPLVPTVQSGKVPQNGVEGENALRASDAAPRGGARTDGNTAPPTTGSPAVPSSSARARSNHRFQRVRNGAVAALALAVAMAAGAVAVMEALRRGEPPQQPVYLLVDRGTAGEGPVDPRNGDGAAARRNVGEHAAGLPASYGDVRGSDSEPGGAEATDPATTAPRGSTDAGIRRAARAARAGEREGLEAPVRRRASEFGHCFARHVEGIEGNPQMVLRFDVDENGGVRNVALEPASLEALPLGRCVLEVARTTRFPPREEPVVFRIPLGARRAP
jgi:serine/threonine-protein kinase